MERQGRALCDGRRRRRRGFARGAQAQAREGRLRGRRGRRVRECGAHGRVQSRGSKRWSGKGGRGGCAGQKRGVGFDELRGTLEAEGWEGRAARGPGRQGRAGGRAGQGRRGARDGASRAEASVEEGVGRGSHDCWDVRVGQVGCMGGCMRHGEGMGCGPPRVAGRGYSLDEPPSNGVRRGKGEGQE